MSEAAHVPEAPCMSVFPALPEPRRTASEQPDGGYKQEHSASGSLMGPPIFWNPAHSRYFAA